MPQGQSALSSLRSRLFSTQTALLTPSISAHNVFYAMSRLFHHIAAIFAPSSRPSRMRKPQEYKEVPNEESTSLVSPEHEYNTPSDDKITAHAPHSIRYVPALLWASGCLFLATGAVVLSAQWTPCASEPQMVYCQSCQLRSHHSYLCLTS